MASFKNGKFQMEKNRFPAHLERGTWAVVTSRYNEQDARKAVDSLGQCAKRPDIRVEEPQYIVYDGNRVEQLLDILNGMKLEHFKILFFVLDNRSETWYHAIKRELIEKRGIPSQMALKHNFKKNLSYFSGILNQMVVKIGGMPFSIELGLQNRVSLC
jgi:hypothetical protein